MFYTEQRSVGGIYTTVCSGFNRDFGFEVDMPINCWWPMKRITERLPDSTWKRSLSLTTNASDASLLKLFFRWYRFREWPNESSNDFNTIIRTKSNYIVHSKHYLLSDWIEECLCNIIVKGVWTNIWNLLPQREITFDEMATGQFSATDFGIFHVFPKNIFDNLNTEMHPLQRM